ncbi:MAG TPA: NHLP family bacteriocin export ABC transporter peptidase/permease/ATPase subunit [Thermoanaerobaculaceae bacterium]|nr:NHLP family bacteriocin export ABC transporter peptidase/permease/ATPase subunit [Thermoanaerobaculaceae bacterium]
MAAQPQEAKPTPPLKPPPNRRVKTPTVLQMEAVECGAAALSIVLGYYDRLVPLEELRLECGVSRDGSKANNVVKAARKYGLEAKGVKYDNLEKLYDLRFPVILFWNFNHFLVLEGFKGGKAYLSDPASGPRVVTMEELDASFSGVVLTFEPSATFKPGGQKRSMRAALQRRLEGSEKPLMFVVVCGLFLVVPGLVVPTFSRMFIDEYLVAGRVSLVQPLLMGMALTAILRMALTFLQQHYLLRMESKLALVHSSSFFNHILRLPVSYFAQRAAGEIGSRVQINDKVAEIISGRLATTVIDCVLLVFYAILMFFYDVSLTLVCIVIAAANVGAVKFVARKRIDASRRLLQDQGKLTGTATYGLRMIETLKSSGSEPEFFARWAGYQAKSLRSEQELGLLGELTSAVPPLVSSLTTAVILLLGSLKVMNGAFTVGMLVAYQSLMASFTRPLNTFVSFGSALQELEADMNRLDDVLQYKVDAQYTREEKEQQAKAKAGAEKVKLFGYVELRDVTFGYSPLDKPLIEKFNLKVSPGQRVALVGRSGSGKSTVSRLLSGLYQPWAGQVLFDGVPREELPPSLIRNSVAMVDQEIFLFRGSVHDNVTMWDNTIPALAVTNASRDACIDPDIQGRLGKYQSLVEEHGGNFSGGQRQRLEIARALVGNPTIVILDEATSALDPPTELAVDDALRRRGCTCIIIAHRLSTIRDADEIIVMDRGKIVQRGTHEEMKDKPGPYRELIKQ